jgi:subtilisin family serine protease
MFMPRQTAIFLVTLILLSVQMVPATCLAKSPTEGSFEISLSHNLVSLDANNASLDAVLAQLAEKARIEVKTGAETQSRVTLSGSKLPIESLMRKLFSNFMFVEKSEENGAVRRQLYVFSMASRGIVNPRDIMVTETAKGGRDQVAMELTQRQKVAAGGREKRSQEQRPDELLVRFRPDVESSQIDALNGLYSAKIIARIPQINICQLKLPMGSDLSAIEKAYRESSLVEKIEPNILLRLPEVIPNDEAFADQWGLEKMMVPEAWNITTGSSSVIVAILDTGIDANHPDLADRIVAGYDIVNGKAGIPEDDHGHGTQMAGIIAAKGENGTGISGINWNCRVLAVKVIDSNGVGSAADVAQGLIYAAEHGAQTVNMSFGGYGNSDILNEAIQYVHQRNVVLVAAAGNEDTDSPVYPAAYPNVLAVTATGPGDQKWSGANFGNYLDLAAPGVGILTTASNGGYSYGTGTSHAAAMVSGVAALLKAKNPRYSNTQIETQLQASADDLGAKGRDSIFGAGRVNAFRALSSSP